MKTFVLTISRNFPKTHKRAGEETLFIEKITCGTLYPGECSGCDFKSIKIHTIRSNYDLWEKRIKQVQEGKAVLSLRYWSDKPYNSKQVEFHRLDKDSGVGIQYLELRRFRDSLIPIIYNCAELTTGIKVAENDGLTIEDFKEWFKNYDLTEPMAIIHFTNFRY